MPKHQTHLKSLALLETMATSPARATQLLCRSNHASSSRATLDAKPDEAANGLTLGRASRTRTVDAGSVAAKITEKLNAKSRAMATTTNLRPMTLVWGEDVVVEIKMQPTTKRLSSKLQLEKVMMVELQAQQLIKPLLVRALMVQDWVLRVTPLGLHLVQPRRWIRGELQLPLLRPLNCWQKPHSC